MFVEILGFLLSVCSIMKPFRDLGTKLTLVHFVLS